MKAKKLSRYIEKKNKYMKNIVLTPISQCKNSASNRDYNDQLIRRRNNEMHCWDDSKENNAVPGDLFGYVENCLNIAPGMKTPGHIEIFIILNIYSSKFRLPQWSENVGQGDRNVVELSKEPIFKGTFKDFKDSLGYSDRYNLQGTRYIPYKKLCIYYDNVLYKDQ